MSDKLITFFGGLRAGGIEVSDVEIRHAVVLPDGRLLFATVAYKSKQVGYPVTTFVTGSFTTMLVVLVDESGELYALLVNQARPSIGQKNAIELVAGRSEAAISESLKQVVREMIEETTIELDPEKVHKLGEYYSSPGMTDEEGVVYSIVITMPKAEIDQLMNLQTGLVEEGEEIRLVVVPFMDLFSDEKCQSNPVLAAAMKDSKVLAAKAFLLQELLRNNAKLQAVFRSSLSRWVRRHS